MNISICTLNSTTTFRNQMLHRVFWYVHFIFLGVAGNILTPILGFYCILLLY